LINEKGENNGNYTHHEWPREVIKPRKTVTLPLRQMTAGQQDNMRTRIVNAGNVATCGGFINS
jgi:hypothetical protein